MSVTPPSRDGRRRALVVLAAALLALAGVGPAIGGSDGPGSAAHATSSDAADPWLGSPSFPLPTPAIRGADGLVPGQPGAVVPVEVDDELPVPSDALSLGGLAAGPLTTAPLTAAPLTTEILTAGALAADDARLPTTCPASAWRIGVAATGAGGTPVVTAALAPDAPDTCQGFSGPLPLVVTPTIAPTIARTAGAAPPTASPAASAPANDRVTARTTVSVTVAVLATPGISVRAEQGTVTVLPIAPTSGPVPDSYTVEIRDRNGDWTPVCTTREPADCDVVRSGDASGRTYRVTARLGQWHRSTSPVAFPTPNQG